MNLEKITRALLKKTDLTPEKVAEKTKLKIRWIYIFKNDATKDYGIRKVQAIYDCLTRK